MIRNISLFSAKLAEGRCRGLICSVLVVVLAFVVYFCIYIIFPNKESSAAIQGSYDYVIGNLLVLSINKLI